MVHSLDGICVCQLFAKHLKRRFIFQEMFGDPNKGSILNKIVQGIKKLSGSTSRDSQCPLEAITVADDVVDSDCHNFLEGIKVQGKSNSI